MPVIKKEVADAIVRPFFSDFIAIIDAAWGDWRKGQIAGQMQHKRVRANVVWNQMLAHARRQFDGRAGVVVQVFKNWDGVLIGDRLFLRMKKGSAKLKTSNFPTQSSLAFHDQQSDFFGGVIRLDLLYVLNRSETDVERIVLVQHHNGNVVWAIDLLEDEGSGTPPTVLPFAPDAPSGSPAQRMIKPKEQRDAKRNPKAGGKSE